MSRRPVFILLGVVIGAIVAAIAGYKPASARMNLETSLREKGMRLLAASYHPGENEAAVSLTFDRGVLASQALYLVPASGVNEYLYISNAGDVELNGRSVTRIEQSGRLLFADGGMTLFIDGRPLAENLRGWQVYWVSSEVRKPNLVRDAFKSFAFYDGFMRTNILEEMNWKVTAGSWRLNQHGGGMPKNEAEAHRAGMQRAVNAFSGIGEKSGVLSYGDNATPHGHVEARFYFGIPRQDKKVIDGKTLPDSDMLVMLGSIDGQQAAFGWFAKRGRFALATRHKSEAWEILKEWSGGRPAITNWVKLGLDIRNGQRAIGYLDDMPAAEASAPREVCGPFHIAGGEALIEFDDVRAWSLPAEPPAGSPVFQASRNFAAKQKLDDSHDPVQFLEWARGERTFVPFEDKTDSETLVFIANRKPLFGDFLYESVPFHQGTGKLPNGMYEFRLLRKASIVAERADKKEKAYGARFDRNDDGWLPLEPPAGWPAGHREFTLRLRRSSASDNRVEVKCGERFIPVSTSMSGPMHLAVGRVGQPEDRPRPEHHLIYDSNLVNELFEEAPSEWSWIDGQFRMDARWACQNQWNFMSCGSNGVPFMVSKRTFQGDQEHDYYLSLRPVFPWDTGDEDFVYEANKDSGWKIFVQHEGWYNRHDLNFSFCSDGKNPLSGYSVVFAGDDNTETRLLRKGEVVASTTKFFIPREKDHGVVHWRWWHFHVARYGNRMRVFFNDAMMFDYEDPQPLDGPHVGFWTVRGGFTIARVTSAAQRVGSAPHILYVDGAVPPESGWRPLLPDSLAVKPQDGALNRRVTLASGAGFHAIRYTFPTPVDLNKTAVLQLPLKIPSELKLNLHLHISGKSYLLKLTAPVEKMKSLLTPDYEKGEQCRLKVIDEKTVVEKFLLGEAAADGLLVCNLRERLQKLGVSDGAMELQSITIGNTSNANYLLAGADGNNAGMSFEVGTPVILDTESRTDAVKPAP